MDINTILILTAKAILFLIVIASLIYTTCKLLKMEKRFVPIFVFTSISLIVYFAGMLGYLLYGVYLVLALGGISVIYTLKKLSKARFSLLYISAFQLLFGAGTLLFFSQLLRGSLTHYDNYTHWATVVKDMLLTNAIPTPDSVMIEFMNYPLGTSSFIYFVCVATGNTSQGMMIFAQGLIIFAGILAIFGIVVEKNRFLLTSFIAAGFSVLSIFNLSIRINDLLVDFILPIISLATIAVIYKYKEDINKALITMIPMLGFLMIVKSTGVIYASFAIVFLLYNTARYNETSSVKQIISNDRVAIYSSDNKIILTLKMFIAIGLTFLPTALWSMRQNALFAAVENKFDTDVDQMANIFGGKRVEDVEFIIKIFVSSLFDISERSTAGIVLFQFIGIVACIIGYGFVKKRWIIGKALISLNTIVILYYIGILAMYLFSMPLDEAIYLAGFERYAASMVIFFGGGITMTLALDIERSFHYRMEEREPGMAHLTVASKGRYNTAVVVSMIITLIALTSEYNGMEYNISNYDELFAMRMEAAVGDTWSEENQDQSFLVYASDELGEVTSYYAYYVAKYYLWSPNVEVICSFYEDNLLNLVSQYDYLVIVDADESEKELLYTYFGISGEAGTYATVDLLTEEQLALIANDLNEM